MHLPPYGEATPCVGTWRRLCSSRLHRQCQMVLLETVRWRIEEFLDPLDTTTVYKASECLAGSWNGLLKASLGRQTRHSELIRKSFGVTVDQLRHLESETSSTTLKERPRSTRRQLIVIMRIRCVHSNSPVTDRKYKSSVETWRANCNSRRTWTKWVSSECVRD